MGPVDGAAAVVRQVVAAATEADGADPLDEAALLALRHPAWAGSDLWTAGADGFAWRHDGALDLVVDPGVPRPGRRRRARRGGRRRRPGPLTAWSHGNHPAAAALAPRLRLRRGCATCG